MRLLLFDLRLSGLDLGLVPFVFAIGVACVYFGSVLGLFWVSLGSRVFHARRRGAVNQRRGARIKEKARESKAGEG